MANNKIDTISKNFFGPVEKVNQVSDLLFFIAAILSLLAFGVAKEEYAGLYVWIQSLFFLVVVALFMASIYQRLYFTPRAEDKRRADFLSHAYQVNLNTERTHGYYNNDAKTPAVRIALQLLENSLFSYRVIQVMARHESIKLAGYLLIMIVLLLVRSVKVDLIVIAAQVIFSEQIISRAVRIIWLKGKVEDVYQAIFNVMQTPPTFPQADAQVSELHLRYESVKAIAGITLSSEVFNELNATVSAEWEEIKKICRW